MPANSLQTLEIEQVRVGQRVRASVGDLTALGASIEKIGLLHPVVLRPDYTVVSGLRRLEAFKALGRATIPALIVEGFDETLRLLRAENDENVCREPFTPEEMVTMAGKLRPSLAEEAKERQRKHGGTAPGKKNTPGKLPEVLGEARDQVAKVVGASYKTLERAEAVVASGDRVLIDKMNKTHRVNGVYRQLVVRQKAEAIAREAPLLPPGKYHVIVCDPPWTYELRAEDVSHRAANPYPSMTIEEIKALPVESHAHDNAILWLWATNAHLREAFGVAETWGFTYKTLLTWVKDKMGLGTWLRGQTEHCLLCVRGTPVVQLTNQTTVIQAPAGRHSEKPDAFYALVEGLCPGKRLEMFQRTPREGWAGHGDESIAL